jgi:microcompartment protein CcmK/EutM
MYLARIDGTLTATTKHETLQACRFLIGRRVERDGTTVGEPVVILDRLGARRGSTVLVSTDGDMVRRWLGNTTPARLAVVGIVDDIHLAAGDGSTPGDIS